MPQNNNAWASMLQNPLALEWATMGLPDWAKRGGISPERFVNRFMLNNPNSIAANQYRNYYRKNADFQVGVGDDFRNPVNPFPEGTDLHSRWSPTGPSRTPPQRPGNGPVRQDNSGGGSPPMQGPRVPQRGPQGPVGGGNVPTRTPQPNAPESTTGGGYRGGVPNPVPASPPTQGNPGGSQVQNQQPPLPDWAGGLIDWINQIYGGGGDNLLRGILSSSRLYGGYGGARPGQVRPGIVNDHYDDYYRFAF